MKKIKLSFKNTKEVLSRDELKSIVGGFASGSGSGSEKEKCNCNTKDDCDDDQACRADCEHHNGFYGHCVKK